MIPSISRIGRLIRDVCDDGTDDCCNDPWGCSGGEIGGGADLAVMGIAVCSILTHIARVQARNRQQ